MATRTVTGSWRSFSQDGSRPARTGTVTFEPSTIVRDSVTNEIVVQDPVTAQLDSSGDIAVQLQVTDEANLNPVGWFWNVTEKITGLTARRYQILLPASGSAFDLSDVEVPYTSVEIDPDEVYIRGFTTSRTVLNPNQDPTVSSTVVNSVANVTYGLPRAAAVTISSATAGSSPTDAQVSNSGSNGDVALDFVLPRTSLELGDVSVVNPDQNPTVVNSGDTGDAVFDFELPRAPTFTVGTVTPGADETDAVVTDVGADGDIVLDITVPRGVAATADVGTVTVVNPDQNPDVANSGTTADAVFDFDLPRAPTFTVGTVTTVNPATPADVQDVGVDGDIVLDFDIPRGQDGDGTAYYGQMYNQSSQTVTITTAGTYVPMAISGTFDSSSSFGIVAPTTATFGLKNDSGATQLLTIVATADVEIGNNKTAGFRLAKNGTALPETTCTATTGTQNFAKLMTQWMVELDDGDELSLLVANLTDTTDIDVDRSKIVGFTAGRQGEQGEQGTPGVVSATAPIDYDSGTQTVSWSGDTDDVPEGSNLYYTDARADARAIVFAIALGG